MSARVRWEGALGEGKEERRKGGTGEKGEGGKEGKEGKEGQLGRFFLSPFVFFCCIVLRSLDSSLLFIPPFPPWMPGKSKVLLHPFHSDRLTRQHVKMSVLGRSLAGPCRACFFPKCPLPSQEIADGTPRM